MRTPTACLVIGSLAFSFLAGCERKQPETASAPPAATPEATAPAAPAAEENATISVALTGAAEAPQPGDEDGKGTAQLTLNPQTGEVCYDISVENIDPPNAAHIHTGAAGTAGPPAVPFNPPAEDGSWNGCVNADAATVNMIIGNPAGYYVNVHNAKFPGGAVRGQLSG